MRAVGNFLLVKRQDDDETDSGLIVGQSNVYEIISRGKDVTILTEIDDKIIITKGDVLIPVARFNNVFAVRERDVVAVV